MDLRLSPKIVAGQKLMTNMYEEKGKGSPWCILAQDTVLQELHILGHPWIES